MIKNFEESALLINGYMNQEWEHQYKQDFSYLPLKLFIQPSISYLGVFNRLTVTGNSFTFSFDDITDKAYMKTIKALFKKSSRYVNASYFSSSEPLKPVYKPFDTVVEKIEHVVQSVFSENYLLKNGIHKNYISWLLRKDESNEHFHRLEEMVGDLRIVLLIISETGEMKLSYGKIVDGGYGGQYPGFKGAESIFNPVSAYYYMEFDYRFRKYDRFSEKHNLSMMETQGYEHTLYNNNKQSFITEYYNTAFYDDDEDMLYLALESVKSCKRQLKQILDWMILYVGKDLWGKLQLQDSDNYKMDAEQFVDKPDLKEMLPFLISGNRVYVTPQYTIGIEVKPVIMEDINETRRTLLTNLDIWVEPFDTARPEDNGQYLHPIVYDLGK